MSSRNLKIEIAYFIKYSSVTKFLYGKKHTNTVLFRTETPSSQVRHTTDWWYVGLEPTNTARHLGYQEPGNHVHPWKKIPGTRTYVM